MSSAYAWLTGLLVASACGIASGAEKFEDWRARSEDSLNWSERGVGVPPPPPRVANGCAGSFIKAADPDVFHPPAARAEGRAGAAVLEVKLKAGTPQPVAVNVIESSSHADLDEAAVRTMQASTFAPLARKARSNSK